MNPRYLAYCRAHGRAPAAMLDFDRVRAPGGHMGPYIRWVSARWEEWRREHDRKPMSSVYSDDHVHFNEWLDAQTTGRLALVRLLAALHADGERLIDLLCVATDDLDAEQEAAFLEFCANGDLGSRAPASTPEPAPAREKARRPRKVPGQTSLF